MQKVKLTPYQSIFYYEWLSNPSRTDYNIVADNIISGEIDLQRLMDSFEKLIHEHFISCHTISNQADGIFWQPKGRTPINELFTYHDYPLSNDEINQLVSAPFDLENSTPARVDVINLGEQRYRVIFSFHHIMVDGVSTQEFWTKISQNYNSIDYVVPSIDEQTKLHQQLNDTFDDIMAKQKRHMTDFWQKQLKEVKNIDLTFLKSPKISSDNSNEFKPFITEYLFSYDEQINKKIRTLRRQYKMTTYMFGQLVLALLLHKMANQSDIPLVYPIVLNEGKALLYGAHVNTIPVVYHFKHHSTLQSVIDDVINYHKEVKQTGAKYLPIYDIMQYAENSNILDVAFVQTFFRDHGLNLDGIADECVNHEFQIDLSNKLVFEQEEHNHQLNYRVKFNEQQLDGSLVKQFIALYQSLFLTLLDYLTSDRAHVAINDIELLDRNAYQHLVYELNQTEKPYEQDKIVAQLFEEQCQKTPFNTAVIFEQTELTYAELNAKANRLAHYLKAEFDIKPNELVGLYLDRSEHIIVCILAILKAGGAYVPMDPNAPDERNSFIIQDANLKAVITLGNYAKKISTLVADLAVISVNCSQFNLMLHNYSTDNVAVNTTVNDLAYAIYTSGTTGNPKGTLIEQHNINRLIINANFVELNESDRIVSIAGYQFDASTYEIFGALLNGAAVVIATKDNFLDLEKFNQLIEQHNITNFFATATFFNTLVDAQLPNLARLRCVLAGGEALSAVHVNKFLKRYPHVKLVNGYGPTETTTFALTYLANQSRFAFMHNVPIGKPLSNTTLYILDENCRPVPKGCIGELYIGGAGVGRGYLNNPEMTNKVFIDNPFQTEEQQARSYNNRIYKTGDLVRYLPDGNVEYIGRNDFQVKIRGFRIELGEIESRLMTHPQIKQALVVALNHGAGHKYLVAYYVADNPLLQDELADYLQQTLPEYMVPSAFVYLESMPVNINGKIDRQALPVPSLQRQTDYVKPTTQSEQQLVAIIAEILGLEQTSVSIIDDFYRLGGNSILAIKLSSKIARAFNRAVRVADIFTYRTAQALAVFIDGNNQQRQSITIMPIDNPQQQLLSFAQERLWFIDCYEGGSNAYNIPLVFQLLPGTNMRFVEQALHSIIERHEILRTLIKTNQAGIGYQHVIDLQLTPFTLNTIDCANQAELDKAIYAHVNRVFSLAQEFPISVNHYRLASDNYMSIIIHHVAFDGWSTDLFFDEFFRLYQHFSMCCADDYALSTNSVLAPVEVQYKDFALWQREYLQGEVIAEQLLFWQQQLAGFEPLNLPTDYVRPLQIDYHGQDIRFELDAALSKQIRSLANELNVSVYSVLLSGFYLLLGAFSNQKDIVVGSPIAGRHYQGIENTLGFFVNTLALRQSIEPKACLTDFILQTSKLVEQAQSHQDLPFERLVDALAIEKDASRHPIFQVMFGVQSFGSSVSQGDIAQVVKLYQSDNIHQSAKFDMTVMLDDSKPTISGLFNYATKLYHEQTIHHYITIYQCILQQFTRLCQRQQPVADLRLIDENTYQRLIFDWNETNHPYANKHTIAELVELQVQKTPHNTAVIFNDIELSYQQLNEQANQLAHYLKETFDIKPNDLIGLYLERSELIVVSILAILKAGGAYVPMDPNAPDVRNEFIMQDAQLKAVLTQSIYRDKLARLMPDLAVLALNQRDFIDNLQRYSIENVQTKTTPADLAYVIYTSGTTGKPKGTLIEQHNINRLVINANYTEIDCSDRLLSISGYQFDASTYDIFGSLLNGACVVIAAKDVFLDLAQFDQLICDKKITNFFATTTFFNALVDYELTNLKQLNYILVGGEALSAVHVNKFRSLYPQVKLVNAYGPTETTTFAVTYLTNHAKQPFDHSVPIGKALTNTSLYILDEYHRPVPMGAIGELYIGGAGVGRGYLHNNALTSKVFIQNPFQTLAEKEQGYNGKIYKTGDLVRYLADGNIDYIGRNDFQIKIRGFRVELTEIEARLVSHPDIQQAAVLALNTGAGTKYLAAYYVAKQPLNDVNLVAYLQQSLPEYMLPAVFIHLDAMPMNMNGKMDRKALPIPLLTNDESYTAPSNDTEVIFCQTFAKILGLDANTISIDDDFFKLGGDSISSIQLANRIKQSLGYYLSIKEIFNFRTVRALSDFVSGNKNTPPITIKAEQGILDGSMALAPIQQWFFRDAAQGKLPDFAHWNQSFLLHVPELDIDLLKLSVVKLLEYHDMLRMTYEHSQTPSYQPLPDELPFDVANIAGYSADKITQLLTDWQSHFKFNQGLLCHIGYLTGYADHSARIHVAVHHLNIDAVSWRIIKDDLQTIYQFFVQQSVLDPSMSAEAILGNKGTSYRQWVNQQQDYLPLANHEQAYWQTVLADLPSYHEHINHYRTDSLYHTKIQLSNVQTQWLLCQANQAYGTEINDILLTALAQSLKLAFNYDEHYVLLEGHGREDLFDDIDINNTVGWFTSMFPVKLVATNDNVVQNVASIKDSLRSIPHHGIGYGILIGYIDQALPAICFNYLGQFDSSQSNRSQQICQWRFSDEESGLSMSSRNRTTDFLSLNGAIIDEQLQFTITGYVSAEQGERFSMIFSEQLAHLIHQLTQCDRTYLTQADINQIISPILLNSLQMDREVEAIFPANSLQQGFIYHAAAQGELDNAYRIQMIWDYYNPIKAELLKQAWQLTQAKYPALRLRFSWDEELIQIIDKQSGFDWQFIDLSELNPAQQSLSINALVEQDELISYDLTKGNLFRIYLIKRAENDFCCLFNNHHAILDGWSLPILLNDVHHNYLALLNHQVLAPETDKSYLAAQSFLQTQIHETQLFWQNYLNIELEQENLASLLKPNVRHINLSEHKLVEDPQEIATVFKPELCRQLKALCKHNGFTLNALIQYCWHQQLSVFGNATTTVIGMTVSGRNLPIDGIENSVGLYINTLPVILTHTNDSVIDHIKKLQIQINDVNNHSNINLIELQKAGTRLFNSLFVFENYPISQSDQEQLTFVFKEGKEKLDYPLGVVAFDRDGEVTVKIKYAGELFSQSAIERLLQGIVLTLTQLIENPTIDIKALDLLTKAEKQQLLVSNSHHNIVPFERHKLVSELFEEQVQKTPHHIAIVYEQVALTYQSLNEQANQLANYLRQQIMIYPDDLIALYLDKSHYMIISILAVLKAGAAYVPISPSTPAERIELILNDTQAKGILTHAHYQTDLSALNTEKKPTIIAVDQPNVLEMVAQCDHNNIDTTTQANNLAYIIYTSGTTGQPKGVMIEHHGISNLATVQQAILDLEPDETKQSQKNVLWYSNYIFDAHAFEIYNALLNGHNLHILSESKRLDFMALAQYIEDNRIDFAFIPPALLDQDMALQLPVLTVGGEAISTELVQRYCQQGVKLINVYGPSETTVWAMAHHYRKDDLNTNLGQAIYNVTLYILDEHLRLVPPGVTGELYIGGAGVGRGYLNNPDSTKQSFICNPFQTSEEQVQNYNGRIYKTGDLVRHLPDGNIEYIGRNDFQVKIRGFRIELGEIESRLISHPQIKQALVLALNNRAGNKYLAAYYVADSQLEQAVISDYLQQSLPEYMLPAAFVHLHAMPVNINGKVDRKALPIPDFVMQTDYVAPQTSTELQLVNEVSTLLGLDVSSVSITDDFFRLGGNSILAIKLSNNIARIFDRAIRVADIFAYRTVQALAQYVDASNDQCQTITIIPVVDEQDQRLSFAQERLWFIDCYEGGSNAYNIPLVFKLLPKTQLPVVEQVIQAIMQRHEILRTLIKTNQDDVGYQQVVSLEQMPITINTINCHSQEALDKAIHCHVHRVFALAHEFPISVNHYSFADNDYMSIVIHHIAFDGWSVDLFINEFTHLYRYFMLIAQGNSALVASYNLPPVEVQYKDFALWQRNYLQGKVLDEQLQFWQQKLAHFEPLNLPTDYVRPLQIDYSGADVAFTFDVKLSKQIRRLASELNVSVYSVLLSGFYLLLSSFSNQKDIVVGSPVAGRHHQGIENTIGFFVNTLALRQCIDPKTSLTDFISQTSQLVEQAQDHQDLPFERLVDVLAVEKDASRHPIFQVMFGVQSFGSSSQGGEEDKLLEIYKSDHTHYQTAKFDMTVMLDDSKPVISGLFNYATKLYNQATIEHYITVYQGILQQFMKMKQQQQPLTELSLVDTATYQKLIFDWNKTRCDYPTDVTVHQLFERQVLRTPNNLALVYESDRLTYQELNEQANQLAHYLREQFDIQPDDLIALCLERSKYMLISILAILKAGGAYVPMDPNAPEDRIGYMLCDTQAKVVLTTDLSYDKVKPLVSTDQAALNLQSLQTSRMLSQYPTSNPAPWAKPKNLAYVIYTSGTTGNPKGVMLEHQGAVNRIVWMHNEYPITEQDHILQKTNYTFDVSVWELFWANWYGACIVFAHSELYKDNVYLSELIESEQITVLHFVPSMLVAFVETLEAQPDLQPKVQGLKYLFCSGEALNLYEVKKCQKLMPSCQIHNLYGPTEATVDVLYYDCNNPDIAQVLIGKPIANTSAYVLNELLQPVPIGGIGELFIGGDNVARGYLNNVPLSNERFITNPFQTATEKAQQYNGRIYKTGDLVRALSDGNIEYLGRNDFQVKIRGFRIELGEIEARLTQYAGVKHSIVIAHEQASGSKFLVAYYLADNEIDSPLLQAHLHETLPAYMVPSAFIHLSELPITSNGKLNRRALPKPELTDKVEYVAPENSIEVTLTEIFGNILKIAAQDISMQDSFFKLGGNSILAMMLNNRINNTLKIKLRLVDILSVRTIRELATKIATAQQQFNPIVEFNIANDKPKMFMIHPGLGGCDVYMSLANKLSAKYSCFGVDSYNLYHDDRIDDLKVLAQYYLDYLDKVVKKGEPITLLGWSLGGNIALEMAIQLESRGIKNIKIYLLDTWLLNPGDLNADVSPIDLNDVKNRFNIPEHLSDKLESMVRVDNKLVTQHLSAKLKTSQIVFFKAKHTHRSHELSQKYTLNNIDTYLDNLSQLKWIEIDCDHYTILAKELDIIEHIR
ncbi:non-ribosomal peptide synthase protein (TIGR01720 family)/amino acid adenylation domain-containing protein [Orbus hercynius]|uniref:Non-ribosomal peptide synthase protein (TIGR01720 family)/amino acid adenylation domain-containing protein n=1 Tax=Orbus hercynius TaxID=593135 RepID=A0A495RJ17_9GAMM|nr:non-ribosomal peptide synthetase [Orbus hercynius]RKS87532.1 non-ribosomal peptide synthase protein (TIGR01720 family)/amino acid adenylation domain-containing protein [Orbus hercynius]